MKHLKKRISNIVGELTIFLFSMGATDINIDLKERETKYILSLSCNYRSDQEDKIKTLIKALEVPKGEAIEEYYWGLVGNSDCDTELTVVGSMIDDYNIYYENNILKLTLYKNR